MLSLNLPVPQQDSALAMTDPTAIQQWLSALPYAQADSCALQLHHAISQLNQCIINAPLRTRLLQHYQTAIERILPVLLQDARPHELSHTPRARNAATQCQQLLLSLHHGHKLAATERARSSDLFFSNQAKLDIFTQALLSARDLVWLGARSYSTLPAGFWQDCHQLYHFASQQSWITRSATGKGDSLALLYRQILLLGMTACNRFSPPELEHLLPLIRKYATQLRLTQHARLPADRRIFVFHPALDSPPRFLAALPLNDDKLQLWQADVSDILTQLQERIAGLTRLQHANPQRETEEEKQLSLRLYQQWEQPQQRRLPRRQATEKLQLVSLLAPCWFVANNASWHFPHCSDTAPEAALPPAPTEFDIINTSGSGLRLRGHVQRHPIRTGEIVLLCPKESSHWQLGIVRWVNLLPQGLQLEYGVELAGLSPQPVMSRPVITHASDRHQMALRLPALAKLDTPSLLILSGRQYDKLREFHIIDHDGEHTIRATRLAMQTAHYQFVEYRPA